MKFMCMHKVDATMESGQPPSERIIREMGQFVGGLIKSGVFKDGAGLHRSANRARVTFTGGTPSVARGPYEGSNELIASFALISTTGIERAIELGTELGRAAGDCEVEVGPVVEGWDLVGKPRPADAPYRFLLLVKANAAFEAGSPEPAPVRKILDRWKREGLLSSDTRLAPSKSAVRTKVTGGKRHWVDGPFTESKELIAGFCVFELPSLEEARTLTEQYVAILGDNECDLRVVAE
jgi:hypothetical protein